MLAGLGGALQIPKEAVNLQMDIHIIAEAFVVVVIGGMGSVTGAFLAALLVGLLSAFGILVFPQLTLVLTFLVMAVVLMIRPYGLLGRPEAAMRPSGAQAAELPLRPADASLRMMAVAVLAAMVLLPTFAGEYAELLATEILILALFAASLS
jgi:branched-chain amino acid transport system permease protein